MKQKAFSTKVLFLVLVQLFEVPGGVHFQKTEPHPRKYFFLVIVQRVGKSKAHLQRMSEAFEVG